MSAPAVSIPLQRSSDERRAPSVRPRLSWAHGKPFGGTTSRPGVRRWQRRLQRLAVVTDAVAAGVVFGAAVVSLGIGPPRSVVLSLLCVVVWFMAIAGARGYEVRRIGAGPDEFQALLRGAAGLLGVVTLVSYVSQLEVPRRLVLVGIPAVALLSCCGRYLCRRMLHRRRMTGRASFRTLLVGEPLSVAEVQATLQREFHYGYHVVGVCSRSEAIEGPLLPLLGAVSEIPQVVIEHDIDVVIVAGGELRGTALRRLSWALEHTSAELVVAPGLVEVAGPRVAMRPTAGLSLLHVERTSGHAGRRVGKAALDYALGVVFTLAALPVIGAAALAVTLTSPGPAFYKQTRVGLDGTPFTMLKLRTMVADADRQRTDLLESSDRDGLMFKMRRDPRVTPVGRVLRRFSVDELPQLFNVVRGNMSLVGPRPPLASEVENYRDSVHRRLRVRPGLTGLWQVSGRADLTWDESMLLDLRYVDNWSVSMDLLILWKTGRAVLGGSGAY